MVQFKASAYFFFRNWCVKKQNLESCWKFEEEKQYDPNVHTSFEAVIGTGSFGKRITDAKIQLGASLKTSLALEFSAFKGSQVGFEAGMMIDAYSKKIEIMGLAENKQIFPSAFFTLFYGISK